MIDLNALAVIATVAYGMERRLVLSEMLVALQVAAAERAVSQVERAAKRVEERGCV